MSTPAQVRAAWDAAIWTHATITALTTSIFDYDARALADVSEEHAAALKYSQEINFFQYLVSKDREFDKISSGVTYRHVVTIQYFKQADLYTDYYNDIEDAFETITDLVQSQLQRTWSGTVAFWDVQSGSSDIALDQIEGLPVWVGQYSFIGIESTTL